MLEMIKRGLILGLGTAVVTKEKVEEATHKLVEQGKLSREDAERLLSEVQESGEKHWDEMQTVVRETVQKAVDGLDLCSKKEFQALKRRVENLEQQVAILEPSLEVRPIKE